MAQSKSHKNPIISGWLTNFKTLAFTIVVFQPLTHCILSPTLFFFLLGFSYWHSFWESPLYKNGIISDVKNTEKPTLPFLVGGIMRI